MLIHWRVGVDSHLLIHCHVCWFTVILIDWHVDSLSCWFTHVDSLSCMLIHCRTYCHVCWFTVMLIWLRLFELESCWIKRVLIDWLWLFLILIHFTMYLELCSITVDVVGLSAAIRVQASGGCCPISQQSRWGSVSPVTTSSAQHPHRICPQVQVRKCLLMQVLLQVSSSCLFSTIYGLASGGMLKQQTGHFVITNWAFCYIGFWCMHT